MTEAERNALTRRSARLSVISNAALVALKLGAGLYLGAVSLVSEAAHSAVDLLAALIAFYAVKKAAQPPDEEHAYGHGKFENLSSAAEAILIVFAAIWIVYESVYQFGGFIRQGGLSYGIAVMLVSLAVNAAVSRRLLAAARITGSQALEADGLHLRADMLTSLGVLAGLAAMRLTGWNWLDPVVAIAVALVIFRSGWRLTLESARNLTDASLPEAEEQSIAEIFCAHAAVLGFHRLRTRRAGAYRLLDVHIVLDGNMRLKDAHAVCDQLETQIKRQLGVCDVVIHAEPLGHHPESRLLFAMKTHK